MKNKEKIRGGCDGIDAAIIAINKDVDKNHMDNPYKKKKFYLLFC